MQIRRGLFITFEGCEGCGKTTQAELLYKYLKNKGRKVTLTREPGGTRVCEVIRNLILHSKKNILPLAELFLFEADRAQHVAEQILPELEKGKIVICDRYTDATLAYQGHARGLNKATIEKLNTIAAQNIIPDLTLLLDYDVKKGLAKARKVTKAYDRLENEKIDFHKKVKEGYLKIAAQNPSRIRIVKTLKTKEETFKTIVQIISNKFGKL